MVDRINAHIWVMGYQRLEQDTDSEVEDVNPITPVPWPDCITYTYELMENAGEKFIEYDESLGIWGYANSFEEDPPDLSLLVLSGADVLNWGFERPDRDFGDPVLNLRVLRMPPGSTVYWGDAGNLIAGDRSGLNLLACSGDKIEWEAYNNDGSLAYSGTIDGTGEWEGSVLTTGGGGTAYYFILRAPSANSNDVFIDALRGMWEL